MAPVMSKNLSVIQRAECGLCGFLALDMFKCMAEARCASLEMPKGSMFMAPQTVYNLQGAALSIVCLCIQKDENWNPFRYGSARLTEMGVEEWFSLLRKQSCNAQLSARSFFQAAGRAQMKHGRLLNNLKATDSPPQPALTEDQ